MTTSKTINSLAVLVIGTVSAPWCSLPGMMEGCTRRTNRSVHRNRSVHLKVHPMGQVRLLWLTFVYRIVTTLSNIVLVLHG